MAAKLAELTGSSEAVTDLIGRLRQLLPATAGLEVLGPVDVDDETVRAVVGRREQPAQPWRGR